MPGEKTEPPTPKRIKDARKKGQVFKSTDITQAALFLTAVAVLSGAGPAYIGTLKSLLRDTLRPDALTGTLRLDEVLHRTGQAWARALLLLAPLLGALCVVAAAMNFLQVRALFAPETIKPNLGKLNPIKGFQNIFFKAKTYLELVKNLIKFAIVLAVAYTVLAPALRDIVLTSRADPHVTAGFTMDLMFALMFRVGAVFLIIGAADFLLQKKLYMKDMKMSKYDVQKEYKEEEGDPHIKQMRKQLHEELLSNAMVEKVPKADAVVVNPTHLAVAIEYDERSMNAPAVTAKGERIMAERIIALAKEHHVPIVRNVPLAHSLFALEPGMEIPEDLYEAVAEVLNWVYQLAQEES